MNLDTLQPVIKAVTEERSPERVLNRIVNGLTQQLGFALTRVWVLGHGDRCESCHLAMDCRDKSQCLHLVASAGHSSVNPSDTWNHTEGCFSRFPLGHRKIGHIGATGERLLIEHIEEDDTWFIDQEWASREGIRAFAGQPLIFRGEVFGVLGIFCREAITQEDFRWLRVFADQAAVALANARAFAEIERLKSELEDENALLREEVTGFDAHQELLGQSPAMGQLLEQIELVAPTDAAILILGESGSGKELVARAVHRRSRRAERPLVRVNCAAIPRELFESEFFGHVKGAFTGAVRDRVGRFQLADRGTLFLDEIGEIPLDLQSKLLRVLQEGEFERIGEATTRSVSVRIIAATNRDLKEEIRKGRFREDLYYRLSVFPVTVPPLRKRRDDVATLLAHFVGEAAHRLGVDIPSVSAGEIERLRRYDWPGNVRELVHVVERAVIMARGGKADFSFISASAPASPPENVKDEAATVIRDKDLRAEQIANICRALDESGGRIYGPGGAAELLGVPPTTLTSRIRRWKISR